jgi:CMP-N,N'-diacetyllegionaminic acid synthase
MNILAIIPAREGSKGIPKKNIKKLVNKPLIAYTISEAKKSKFLSKIIVSTDSKKIEKIAKKLGSETMIRPKKLAQDNSSTLHVIQHVIKNLKSLDNFDTDIVITLQPTSPLRTAADIDSAIKLFLKSKCDSVIGMTDVIHPPELMYRKTKNKLKPLIITKIKSKRRQDMSKTYQVNGAIYICKYDLIMKKHTMFGKNIIPYLMPIERSIDIDTMFDLLFVEYILKSRKLSK